VQVCPTGIDIRKGLQYECIGCAACIDACDHVMRKAGLATGLVRYTTRTALSLGLASGEVWKRVFRPRVLLYGGVLVAIFAALALSLVLRVPLKVDLIRDRGAFAHEAEDGGVENVYRVQVMNTSAAAHSYHLRAAGLEGLAVVPDSVFPLPPASSRVIALRLRADASTPPGSHRITVQVEAVDAPEIHVTESTVFFGLHP
jgi:polyferredoxin